MVSVAVAAFCTTWNPCGWISGVLLLPIPAALAISEYYAVFRNSPAAAVVTVILLLLVGGLALVAFIALVGVTLLNDHPFPPLSFVLSNLGIGLWGCVAGWINLVWLRRLKQVALRSTTAKPIRFSWSDVLPALAAIACIVVLAVYFVHNEPPQYAENVSREQAPFGLPEAARNVSFCRGVRGAIAFEFSVDEASFIEWVESGVGSLESQTAGVSVQRITRPYTILRYTALMPESKAPHTITLSNGLYYDWSKADRGVHAAFDRTTGRAYYYFHAH